MLGCKTNLNLASVSLHCYMMSLLCFKCWDLATLLQPTFQISFLQGNPGSLFPSLLSTDCPSNSRQEQSYGTFWETKLDKIFVIKFKNALSIKNALWFQNAGILRKLKFGKFTMEALENVWEKEWIRITVSTIAWVRGWWFSALQTSLWDIRNVEPAGTSLKKLIVDVDMDGGNVGSLHVGSLNFSRWWRAIKAKAMWWPQTIWKSIKIVLIER